MPHSKTKIYARFVHVRLKLTCTSRDMLTDNYLLLLVFRRILIEIKM